MLTAYDYSTAKYLDEAEIDVILIGDSLAMVALGYENTNSIGVDEMAIFTKAVAKGVGRAMVVTDMPFMSYTIDISSALTNIGKMVKLGANAVKLEGCNDYMLELIKRTTQMGVPVMGHIGFTPQSQNVIGGHIIQGKNVDATLEILEQAKNLNRPVYFQLYWKWFRKRVQSLSLKIFRFRQFRVVQVAIVRDKLSFAMICLENFQSSNQNSQENTEI